jgi:hypothetical protein
MRTRVYSLLLLLAFAFGVVISPAWHKAHCGTLSPGLAVQAPVPAAEHDRHSTPAHDADRCQVCLVAALGLVQPVAAALPLLVLAPCAVAAFPAAPPTPRPAYRLPFSCGPPPTC